MADITITKVNEVYYKVDGEKSTLREIHDLFSFKVPGASFIPSVRNKMWDGIIRLFNLQTRLLYIGLLEDLRSFASVRGYSISVGSQPIIQVPKTLVNSFYAQLDLKFQPRDYQEKAFTHCISHKRAVMLSPTASGKSLIIYLLSRFFTMNNKKVLVVVPTTSLVHQMASDFIDYNKDRELPIHKIMSGVDKSVNDNYNIYISTWQSIYKQPEEWFNNFNCIIGDECHLFKAKSLKELLEKCTEVQYRFGFTGTLDGSLTNEMVLKGLFGPVEKVTTTAELIDKGQLANLNIRAMVLRHGKENAKDIIKKSYQEEIDYLVQSDKRNDFIVALSKKLKGNTLILFRYVDKHGLPLYNKIKDNTDYPCYFISGDIDSNERERIRKEMDTNENSIMVASVGTMSTGVNIKNIHNIVFAAPTKSKVTSLQSIGRGLRLGENKDGCTVYDIADDLRHGSKVNHTFRHFVERMKIYDSEKLKYKIQEFDL